MKSLNVMTGENLTLPTPNWDLFNKFIGNLQIVDTKGKEILNPFQVCQAVFEMTFYHYQMKYYEEKSMRGKLESKVIEKNGEIGKLQQEIKELKEERDELKRNTSKP